MDIVRKIFSLASGYAISESDSSARVSVPTERKSEDAIFPTKKRNRAVAAARQAFRNTTFSPATALQMQVNVIGNVGGRLTLTTDDANFNDVAGRAFRRWSRHAEFSNGLHINELLQLLLIQLTHNGGDFIAVYDDGILTGGRGSGKIRIFESDEIKCVTAKVFNRLYPGKTSGGIPKFYQSNGIVYNLYGQIVGAFVSVAGRKKDEFDDGEFLHLRLPVPAEFDDANWILVGQRWRVNQGRGISTMTHVAPLLGDLAATQASEVQAAKLNAGIGIVVEDSKEVVANQLDDSRTFDDMDGEGCGSAPGDGESVAEGISPEEREAYLDNLLATQKALKEGRAAIIEPPPGSSVKGFDTQRPNLNTVQYIRDQRNEAGTVLGIGPSFTTLQPAGSFTAFRGEMILAQKSFWRYQKKLEREFLDWVAIRVITWLDLNPPEGYEEHLFWIWPKMSEVDEGSYQNALATKFANIQTSLQGQDGADWKKNVDQVAAEVAYCHERGILHPAERTVSGGQTDVASNNDVAPGEGDANNTEENKDGNS